VIVVTTQVFKLESKNDSVVKTVTYELTYELGIDGTVDGISTIVA
jgi:hypothetical protein